MVIFRYLAKEVFTTLCALTSILLLIFMSNQLVRYLGRAANGSIPAVFVFKLLALELPMLISMLMPLGFYMSLLLAYSRLYADSEMTALHACGYGTPELLKHSLIMASGVAAFVLVILLWVNPSIAVERKKLLRSEGVQVLIKTLVPERFSSLPNGRDVIYIDKMTEGHAHAKGVFIGHLNQKGGTNTWDVVRADDARVHYNPETNTNDLILNHGKVYQGIPGEAAYKALSFAQYETPLPEPVITTRAGDLRAIKTKDLWPASGDAAKIAEIQWRFLLPLIAVFLTPIAVALSKVNPRAGKFAKLLPAVLIFILYGDMMFVVRDAIATNKLSWLVGMVGLHGGILLLGVVLTWYNRVRFV